MEISKMASAYKTNQNPSKQIFSGISKHPLRMRLLQNPEKHAVSVQSNKCFLIEAKRSAQLIVE